MPDVEKVIKGMETSLSIGVCGKCVNECWYGDTTASCHDIIHDALALLKAQETVEPKKNYVELAGLRTWDWACPECNCILTYRANYCSCCGRAVKWE